MPVEYFFVASGFIIAGLIAMAVLLVHRRAVRLTIRRLEAALPQSMIEVHAEKNRSRAGYEMSIRSLEKILERLRKLNSDRLAELSRKEDVINQLKMERDALKIDVVALKLKVETTARLTEVEEYANPVSIAPSVSQSLNTRARDGRLSNKRALPKTGESNQNDNSTRDRRINEASIAPTIQHALRARLTRSGQGDTLDERRRELSQIADMRNTRHSQPEDTWDRDKSDPPVVATKKHPSLESLRRK